MSKAKKVRSFRCSCCSMSRLVTFGCFSDPCEGCGFVQTSALPSDKDTQRAVRYQRVRRDEIGGEPEELNFG